jgi:hypothetical protein
MGITVCRSFVWHGIGIKYNGIDVTMSRLPVLCVVWHRAPQRQDAGKVLCHHVGVLGANL